MLQNCNVGGAGHVPTHAGALKNLADAASERALSDLQDACVGVLLARRRDVLQCLRTLMGVPGSSKRRCLSMPLLPPSDEARSKLACVVEEADALGLSSSSELPSEFSASSSPQLSLSPSSAPSSSSSSSFSLPSSSLESEGCGWAITPCRDGNLQNVSGNQPTQRFASLNRTHPFSPTTHM